MFNFLMVRETGSGRVRARTPEYITCAAASHGGRYAHDQVDGMHDPLQCAIFYSQYIYRGRNSKWTVTLEVPNFVGLPRSL